MCIDVQTKWNNILFMHHLFLSNVVLIIDSQARSLGPVANSSGPVANSSGPPLGAVAKICGAGKDLWMYVPLLFF